MALTLSGNSGNTTLDSSNGITFSDSSNQQYAASPFGLKNRIINGDMRIDQRNAGASVTPTSTSYVTVDRWRAVADVSSKYSIQQVSDAPTSFNNSLKMTSLSSYSVGATEVFGTWQAIEGFNSADLAFGTASAKTVTLSFWVKSSLTGTFGGSLQNADYTRGYPFTYTISSANTWEQKTITIAGDTSGTWVGATNGIGMLAFFSIGAGSSRSNTANVWTGTTYSFSATGATSVVGTNGATFYLTGVQLEVGSTATPFERRLYGNELALCQRYYQTYSDYDAVGVGKDTTAAFFSYQLRPQMRAVPTSTFTCANVDRFGTAFTATTAAAVLDSRQNQVTTYATVTMSGRGEPCGPAGSLLKISAEL
jgi:hypothetical protein